MSYVSPRSLRVSIDTVMASFGFAGQDIVGDERDLIRLRTNYRKDPPEDAYLYRTNAPPENVRRLFLSYFQKINELRDRPSFYNTLTTNCTTNVLMHT